MRWSECDATLGGAFIAFIALSLLRLVFFLNFFALFLEQMNKICNKCKNGSLKNCEKAFTTLLKKIMFETNDKDAKKNVGKDKWHFKRGF